MTFGEKIRPNVIILAILTAVVTVIFGVMLTSRAPFVSMKIRAGEWILAAIVGGSLLALLLWAACFVEGWRGISRAEADALPRRPTASRIGLSFFGAPTDRLQREQIEQENPQIARLSPGMSGYLLPFEIVSVHLLVVLVGAAYLARTRRRSELGRREVDSP